MAELQVIAVAHNGFSDKFGIPRQSREESHIETRIVFEPEFRDSNMIRGIEDYSHLWLIWGFTEAKDWSATVRPPRLGGNTRMGVFATRSPYRPNHLGLSSVRLLRIEDGDLIVSGADLLDGTPIYDIKPYLSFSDAHPDASNGFAEATKDYALSVKILEDLVEVLRQDPRPAYQDDDRIYKLDYQNYLVEFQVIDNNVIINKITKRD
ncbi:MAG: tRNA (N6-threonylcarbamoyladenosine(37)-N6)-methyltransferase TrmO [Paludibacteraceae bacterium]|nr:tRNA (N6-threonylcarbamoyladenosine(37)-N6)-methyltransferase TrmO [Paludibacteraceae bacterium]